MTIYQSLCLAFNAIIKAMVFSEETVMEYIISPPHLTIAETDSQRHTGTVHTDTNSVSLAICRLCFDVDLDFSRKAVIQITHLCIQEAVYKEEAHEFVHRFILSLLLQVKGDSNASHALEDVETACGIISAHPSIILDKNSSSACRSVSLTTLDQSLYLTQSGFKILWIVAEKFYAMKKWSHAAQWFLLSSSPAFRALPAPVNAKSLRKAALCYVYQGEYAHASSIVLRCPGNEAATHYLAVLAAAYQGEEILVLLI